MGEHLLWLSELSEPERGDVADDVERISHAHATREFGDDDAVPPCSRWRLAFQSAHRSRDIAVVVSETGVRGAMFVRIPQVGDTNMVVGEGFCHVEHGDATADGAVFVKAVEDLARDVGRSIVCVMHTHRFADGVGLAPAAGGIPIQEDVMSEVLANAGFALAYTARHSRLVLGDNLDGHVTPSGYRFEVWDGPTTPASRLEQYAKLRHALETDSPDAGLTPSTSQWSAERVRAEEADHPADSERLRVVAIQQGSDELVGCTDVSRQRGSAAVMQDGTVVLAEHRGQQLGLAMKQRLVVALRDLWPDASRVHTWNEATNDPMWSINRSLGFEVVDVGATWEKLLD